MPSPDRSAALSMRERLRMNESICASAVRVLAETSTNAVAIGGAGHVLLLLLVLAHHEAHLPCRLDRRLGGFAFSVPPGRSSDRAWSDHSARLILVSG